MLLLLLSMPLVKSRSLCDLCDTTMPHGVSYFFFVLWHFIFWSADFIEKCSRDSIIVLAGFSGAFLVLYVPISSVASSD